jgi:hypothetical protein
MPGQPWASGPREILQHGLSLLHADNDKNRRLALLSIDNAVELMIKTFLGLPKRITGILISRKDFAEISESFPRMLDALEEYAADSLDGINIGEIEWFHRLRNQLYHQGNGLTVDRDKVEVYAELAKVLYNNLFGDSLEVAPEDEHQKLGAFLAAWVDFERMIGGLSRKHIEKLSTLRGDPRPPLHAIRELSSAGVFSKTDEMAIDELRRLRNEVIHGTRDYKSAVTDSAIKRLRELTDRYSADQ